MSTVSALNLTNDKLPKVIFIILELFIGLEKFKFRLGLNTCLLDTDYVRRNFQASIHAGFNFFLAHNLPQSGDQFFKHLPQIEYDFIHIFFETKIENGN